MLRLVFICAMIFSFLGLRAQSESWMIPPVKHQVRLSGTFGELRTNHFHTGVDIKADAAASGDQLQAIADGFISRIKISSTGYGNALYIDHPNGKTSVYAHMESFYSQLDSFVENIQYSIESFEFDTTLQADVFPITQGQIIGMMGNSGRSMGKHLHFEIRETSSEIALNPLQHGLEITDNIGPKIEYAIAHFLDDKGNRVGSQKIDLIKKGGMYTSIMPILSLPAWRIGIAVYSRDLMTGVSNNNGIYSGLMSVDAQKAFSFELDSISFDHFRYLNAHIDYETFKKKKIKAHQFYRLPGNEIPIYTESSESIIKLYANQPREVEFVLSDFHKNESRLKLAIVRDTAMTGFESQEFQYFLEYQQEHIINRSDVKIKFDEGTFYKDCMLSILKTDEKEENYLSDVYFIGDEKTPLHRSYDLYISPKSQDSVALSKSSIVLCEKGKYYSYGGELLDGLVGAKVASFGAYVIMQDTIPPVIEAVAVPVEVRNGTRIKFKITDNLEIKGQAKDLQYRCTIDDQWILMTYDMKNDMLVHEVSQKWGAGEYILNLVVTDDKGNEQSWERKIIKK